MNKMNNILYYLALLGALFFMNACKHEADEPQPEDNSGQMVNQADSFTIWNGADVSFIKASGADPTLEANQDRITDEVWITRGNSGGQIFNAKTESSSTKSSSPAGTLWAIGTLDNILDLSFKPFREAVVKPQSVIGKDLVMFLEKDKVYLSLKITAWSSGKNGGFAYTRSTKP